MAVAILLVAILPALLVVAAVFGLISFTIPNIVPAAIGIAFVAFLAAMAMSGHALSLNETGLHVLAGFLGLAAGMALFAFGWVGGGDAKLFAVVALWLGWDALYEYTVISSLLGGALTIGLLLFRRIPLPAFLARRPWLAALADHRSGVPYGIALSLAALMVLPETELFRLAAAS